MNHNEILKNLNPNPLFDLMDQIQDIQFWIKNKTGSFLKVNKGFLDNYALEHESQAIGKTDFELSLPFIAEQFVKDDLEVLKGKSIINRVELVNSANQVPRWFVTNKRALYTINGELVGTIGISRSLSEGESLEIPIKDLYLVTDYIKQNIQNKIKVTDLANLMNCSVNTLERKFWKMFHCTPINFIMKIKIEYAGNALIMTDQQVSSIAFNLGFSDNSHFIRIFKKYMKITPHQYRKSFHKEHFKQINNIY